MNISLPENLRDWLEEQLADGGFETASEYVRHLLREERKRKVRAQIDAKLLESLDSGESTPMTAADWNSLRQDVQRRLKNKRPQ